jgi:alpha-L-fucosidase 2
MGWKVNWWAKLQDGNHAYKLIQNQLTPIGDERGSGGTYNNLFDAHPPFQIDGNFGCISGITEMLMQSADGAVHILPALPDIWPKGSISGLKTRGDFEIVEMIWENSELVKLVVKSNLGGNLRLRLPNPMKNRNGTELKLAQGENSNPFFFVNQTAEPIISEKSTLGLIELKKTYLYDVETQKSQTYTFLKKK